MKRYYVIFKKNYFNKNKIMQKFKTIQEVWEYCFSRYTAVIDRKGYLITFKNWKEAISTFDSEYFK